MLDILSSYVSIDNNKLSILIKESVHSIHWLVRSEHLFPYNSNWTRIHERWLLDILFYSVSSSFNYIYLIILQLVTLILYTISGTLVTFTTKTNSTVPSLVRNTTTKVKKLAKCKPINFPNLLKFSFIFQIDTNGDKSSGIQYMSEVGSRCTGIKINFI